MARFSRLPAIAMASALSLALAACSTGPKVASTAPPAVATQADEVDAVAQLLEHGEVKEARKRLGAALRNDPLNPSLLVLHQGIVGNAKTDLGPTSFPYMVVPGDTMPGLAQRFLGNRLKSYQLARYNGIDDPATLMAGQVIRIPGQAPVAEPERKARPAGSPRFDGAPAARAASKARSAPPLAAAAAPVHATDAAGAQRARASGLAALNKGDPAAAVALLERAATLDPGNDAIARDLVRARRIAATVRSQR